MHHRKSNYRIAAVRRRCNSKPLSIACRLNGEFVPFQPSNEIYGLSAERTRWSQSVLPFFVPHTLMFCDSTWLLPFVVVVVLVIGIVTSLPDVGSRWAPHVMSARIVSRSVVDKQPRNRPSGSPLATKDDITPRSYDNSETQSQYRTVCPHHVATVLLVLLLLQPLPFATDGDGTSRICRW